MLMTTRHPQPSRQMKGVGNVASAIGPGIIGLRLLISMVYNRSFEPDTGTGPLALN